MDQNKIAVSVFNSLAKTYADKYMDVSQYITSINAFINHLPLNATVLELGCGPGNLTKQILSLRPDLKITATDLAPDMLAIAQQSNPSIETLLLDCRELDSLDQKYEGVVIGFVLPYLNDEEVTQLIGDAYNILAPKGIIYLSTIEGAPEDSAWKKGSYPNASEIYQNYYSEKQINQWLLKSYFNIIYTQLLDVSNAKEKDLIIIAEKSNHD